MNKELIFKNYKKSLEQKYNAVCFDIDGTLTEKNSKKIDIRAIEIIINLLIRKIPIVFITGRGETGLKDLKNDIYDSIKNNPNIAEEDLKRIYVLTNDGARLFYSNDVSKEFFLKENIYISTPDELKHLSEVNEIIKQKQPNYFKISYSKDLDNDAILNIRLIFERENSKIIDNIFERLNTFLSEKKYNDVHLTRGIYKDKIVIQIGNAQKDMAIKRTEKLIGIPQNSMMRIGDCGDFKGNDYSMLNCSQGYSTDKTSGSINSCFPIFNEEGNALYVTILEFQSAKSLTVFKIAIPFKLFAATVVSLAPGINNKMTVIISSVSGYWFNLS
mgnify:CR=1 FL=1